METVGSIQVVATINTAGYDAGKKKIESGNKELETSSKKTSSSISSSFGSVADGISSMVKVASAALITGSVGLVSFINQASELQTLKASFESLTGSVESANTVMQKLYDFSFSTAFSSEDINKSAKLLIASGINVSDLSTYMTELGDIAGATGADLQGLTLPISQAMAAGVMHTQDWYQVLNQGAGGLKKYIIEALGAGHTTKTFADDLSNGAVTADVLTKALSLANAEGGFAFEGAIKQSKTFNGQMSNLMETVGNVGLEVLGVNKATGEIDPNGVFAKLSTVVQDATKWLNENKVQIKDVAMILINNAIPAIAGIAAAFATMKAVFLVGSLLADPFILIPIAISAIIAALTFLQIKFNIFGEAWKIIKSTWGQAQSFFADVWSDIQKVFSDVGKWFSDRFNEAINGIKSSFDVFKTGVESVLNDIKKWIDDNKQAIINWSIVIGTLLLPKFTAMSIEAIKSLSEIIAKFAVTSAISIVEAAKATAAWVVGAAQVSFEWVTKTLPSLIVGFAKASVEAIIYSAKTVAAWVVGATTTLASWAVTFAGMVAGFVLMGVQALIAAGKVAASWLLALGPIGLIIAAIVGISALIIANWSTVSKWLSDFWKWFGKVGSDAWNGLMQTFSKVGDFFGGIFNTVKNLFSSIGTAIGDSLGNAFKSVINGVLSFAVGKINDFIGSINNVIGIINKLPGVELGKINKLPIPQLATGGIVSSPTLAMIGEGSEPEAVVPLSKINSLLDNDKESNNKNVTINQTNNISTELDMDVINRNLTWQLRRA